MKNKKKRNTQITGSNFHLLLNKALYLKSAMKASINGQKKPLKNHISKLVAKRQPKLTSEISSLVGVTTIPRKTGSDRRKALLGLMGNN